MVPDEQLLLNSLQMTSLETRNFIMNICRRRCPEWFEDLTHDVFATVLKAIRGGRGPTVNPLGWLWTVTIHAIRRDRRRRDQGGAPSIDSSSEEKLFISHEMPEAMRQDLRIALERLWLRLNDRQKTILQLVLEGATQREIATIIERSLGTVHNGLNEIREHLRRLLGRPDPEPDDDPPTGGSAPDSGGSPENPGGPGIVPFTPSGKRPPSAALELLAVWLPTLPAFRDSEEEEVSTSAAESRSTSAPEPERVLLAYLASLPAYKERASARLPWPVRWLGPLALAASVALVWSTHREPALPPAFVIDIGENPPPHRGDAEPSDLIKEPRRIALDGAILWKIYPEQTYDRPPEVHVFLVGEARIIELDLSAARTDDVRHGSLRLVADRFDSLLPPAAAPPSPGQYRLRFVIGPAGQGGAQEVQKEIELRDSVEEPL